MLNIRARIRKNLEGRPPAKLCCSASNIHRASVEPELLFQAFHTTKTSGTGLGLAIVRRRLSLQGGTVLLKPRDGGGAVARDVPLAFCPILTQGHGGQNDYPAPEDAHELAEASGGHRVVVTAQAGWTLMVNPEDEAPATAQPAQLVRVTV